MTLIATQPLREYDDEHLTLTTQLSRYEYYSWENYAIQPAWPDGTDFVTSGYVARNDPSGPTNHWVYARFGR